MIDLQEELCFILTKSSLLHFKIDNSFSHKVEHFSCSGFTCFADPLSERVECGSLGRRSMLNLTDQWLMIFSYCSIGLM